MNPQTYKLYVQSSPGSGMFSIDRLANPVSGYREVSPTEAQKLAQQHYQTLLSNPNVRGNEAKDWLTKNIGIIGNPGEAYYQEYQNPITGEVMHNVSQSTVDQIIQQKADLAAGKIKQVAPGVFLPTGSAGDENLKNIGTNNTANAANKNIPSNQTEGASQTTNLAVPLSTNGLNTVNSGGFSLTGSNLKYGSSGQDVKNLQQYLIGLGYDVKADGIYGPKTQQAVQQFQQTHGLTPDGIVGPKTVSAIQAIQGGQTPPDSSLASTGQTSDTGATGGQNGAISAYRTGNPEQDALLAELSGHINDLVNKGYTINPNLNIDDNTINQFLTQAQKEIHPYYAQQIEGEKQKLARDLGQTSEQYANEVANKEGQFQSSLGNARESYAGAGLAFSGQRGQGELNMQNTQNRDLTSLSSQYGNQLSNTLQTSEQRLGAPNLSGFKVPELSKYSANLEGKGGFTLGGTQPTYQTGNYQIGSVPAEENQATQTYKNQLLSEAYQRAGNNMSYADLIK